MRVAAAVKLVDRQNKQTPPSTKDAPPLPMTLDLDSIIIIIITTIAIRPSQAAVFAISTRTSSKTP
jgi:hypothetical protein